MEMLFEVVSVARTRDKRIGTNMKDRETVVLRPLMVDEDCQKYRVGILRGRFVTVDLQIEILDPELFGKLEVGAKIDLLKGLLP